MTSKRLLTFILAALCVLQTSCGSVPAETESENTGAAVESSADNAAVSEETEEDVSDDPRLSAKDNLPADLKFDGETVTVLHRGGDTGASLEIVAEEDTGDVVVSAVYNRNLLVEDRLGINIESVATGDSIHSGGGVSDQVRTTVQADSDDFDIFANHMSQSNPLILEGMCLNLKNNQYIDWEQPWWNKSFRQELELADKLYFAVGELSQTMIRGTYVTYVNKEMFSNTFPTEDIYSIVNDGNWTMDKLIGMCEVVYQDANGDGTADINDIYGMALTAGNDSGTHDGFTGACGVELVKKNSEGEFELVIGQELTYTYCDAMKRLLHGGNNVWNTTVDTEPSSKFMSNTAMLYPTFLSATETLRDMESDYGIIPFPKLNDAQADYTGFTHNGFSVFALPVTCGNIDLCGAFLELMCVESYRTVTTAYYEVALKNKYARDDVVSQMLDRITQNVRFDFGYVYSASLGDLIKTFRKLNADANSNPASSMKSSNKVTTKLLEKLVKQISELDT